MFSSLVEISFHMASLTPMNSQDVKGLRTKVDQCETNSQNIEDVSIIWFDQYMDEVTNQKDVETTKTLLRQINDYVLFFSKPEPCIDYVKSVSQEKVFLITTGSYATQYLESMHSLQQLDSIFIFCLSRMKYLPLKEKYSKIIDVYTEQKDLMDSLRNNIELVTKQATVFSLFDGKQRSTRYLTRESASFLWFQLLTDVLKTISLADTDNIGIKDMLTHCQCYYRGNRVELKNIEEFRKIYVSVDRLRVPIIRSFIFRNLKIPLVGTVDNRSSIV